MSRVCFNYPVSCCAKPPSDAETTASNLLCLQSSPSLEIWKDVTDISSAGFRLFQQQAHKSSEDADEMFSVTYEPTEH